jgi:hypothetical protein
MITCQVWATTALHGSYKWLLKSEKMSVLEVTIPLAAVTADETVTWNFNGTATRIVVDVNAVDSDGDITIKDISGVSYLTLTNKLGSGDIDYVIPSVDQNANAYGGVQVAGTHTLNLIDCAAAAPIKIYIYYH